MYRIPEDLDLTYIVGKSTSQICVGQFDIMFNFADMQFSVYSKANIYNGSQMIGDWTPEKWPDSCFYEVMNIDVVSAEVTDSQIIRISFKNGMAIELFNNDDAYECLRISLGSQEWII